jgi:hypothetical protein
MHNTANAPISPADLTTLNGRLDGRRCEFASD